MPEGDTLVINSEGDQEFAAPEGTGITVTDGTTTVEGVTSLRVPGTVSAGGAGEAIVSAAVYIDATSAIATVDATLIVETDGVDAVLDRSVSSASGFATANTSASSDGGPAQARPMSRQAAVTMRVGVREFLLLMESLMRVPRRSTPVMAMQPTTTLPLSMAQVSPERASLPPEIWTSRAWLLSPMRPAPGWVSLMQHP
jgi:hypothetical protein